MEMERATQRLIVREVSRFIKGEIEERVTLAMARVGWFQGESGYLKHFASIKKQVISKLSSR